MSNGVKRSRFRGDRASAFLDELYGRRTAADARDDEGEVVATEPRFQKKVAKPKGDEVVRPAPDDDEPEDCFTHFLRSQR